MSGCYWSLSPGLILQDICRIFAAKAASPSGDAAVSTSAVAELPLEVADAAEDHHRRKAALLRLKALADQAQSPHVTLSIERALHQLTRSVRLRSRTDSAVAWALVQRQEEDAAAARAEQAEWATYTHMVRKRAAVEADVDDACDQLKKVRQNIAAMESLKECQEAMKSFSPASLGHGNKRGGTKAQAKTRMEVLERVARTCGALSPEQTNDWKWF